MSVCEVFGFDLGKTSIGVARGSTGAKLAEPLITLTTEKFLDEIEPLITKHQPAALVFGLPRGLAGQSTEQTIWTQNWVSDLKGKINRPIFWQDEALTSQQAETLKQEFKKMAFDDHAIAAAIILQDFLDSPATSGVGC